VLQGELLDALPVNQAMVGHTNQWLSNILLFNECSCDLIV